MENQEVIDPDKTQTIGEMVAEDYRKAEVFKKFGIDFCCGGKSSLEETCQRKGINVEEVNQALKAHTESQAPVSHNYNEWELDRLIDHILNRHHTYVKENIELLDEYSAKVAKVHGEASPEVVEIYHHYQAVANELRMHMHKEEVILFPYIGELAVANRNNEQISPPHFGTVRNPINMMETEHESAGEALEMIRELSSDYTPPEYACNTYRVLYAKLKEFTEDLHIHIHLESNILFPKAIALEEKLLA